MLQWKADDDGAQIVDVTKPTVFPALRSICCRYQTKLLTKYTTKPLTKPIVFLSARRGRDMSHRDRRMTRHDLGRHSHDERSFSEVTRQFVTSPEVTRQ